MKQIFDRKFLLKKLAMTEECGKGLTTKTLQEIYNINSKYFNLK